MTFLIEQTEHFTSEFTIKTHIYHSQYSLVVSTIFVSY